QPGSAAELDLTQTSCPLPGLPRRRGRLWRVATREKKLRTGRRLAYGPLRFHKKIKKFKESFTSYTKRKMVSHLKGPARTTTIRFLTNRPRCSRCRRNKARPGGRYCWQCHAATTRQYRHNPKRSAAESSALQEDVADHVTVWAGPPVARYV